MIVVDSSAVIAILFGEPEAAVLAAMDAALPYAGADFAATDIIDARAAGRRPRRPPRRDRD